MSVASQMGVEIDHEIEKNPALLDAVHAAVSFLESQVGGVAPPLRIRFKIAATREQEPTSIEIGLFDTAEGSVPSARRNFWTRWLLDPVSREICVLKVWADFLADRSGKNMARMNQLIQKLREEEDASPDEQ